MNDKKITEEKALKIINEGAKKVKNDDLEQVLKRERELNDAFSKQGPLNRFIDDFDLLVSITKDYYHGVYKDIPWWTIAAIIVALLYVLNPVDIIPDIIPVIGQVDDALVIAVCLKLIEKDLLTYKEWKLKQAK